LLCGLVSACGGTEEAAPDNEYDVVITGVDTNCTSSQEGYQEKFRYQLYFPSGSDAELHVGGEFFALGYRSGCQISYQSSVWLDERDEGWIRWQLTGSAEYQGATGGCDLPEGLDWSGTEQIEVTDSENPNVPEGCVYNLAVEGVYVGGGA